jgi:hypothetical protein
MEIFARVERRREWTAQEKVALLAEIEAEGGKVRLVARRHRIAESMLYNWRASRKAASMMMPTPPASPTTIRPICCGGLQPGGTWDTSAMCASPARSTSIRWLS